MYFAPLFVGSIIGILSTLVVEFLTLVVAVAIKMGGKK